MEHISSEDFIFCTINIAKDEFGEKERYISPTRLNKLLTLVFKELDSKDIYVEDFIWGYYRYGFFSQTVSNTIGQNKGLSDIDTQSVELSGEVMDLIYETIKYLKNKFVQKGEDFYKMIYIDMTPKKYSNFYLTHRKLTKWFEDIQNLSCGHIQADLYGKKDMNLPDIISHYYMSLGHVDNPEILNNFILFTDILEFLSLKLNNNANPSKIAIKLDILNSIYKNNIFTLLVPYKETLNGDLKNVKDEKQRYENIVQNSLGFLNRRLDNIYQECDNEGLIPSFDEMKNEIIVLNETDPNSKSLREIYDEIDCIYNP
jgi:hypothetical protein